MYSRLAPLPSLTLLLFLTAHLAWGEPPKDSGLQPLDAPKTDRYGDPLPHGAVARLGTVRFRSPTGRIGSLRFSPDGQSLFSIEEYDRVRIWNAATGEERFDIPLPASNFWDLTPDGRLLAEPSGDHSIRIAEASTGKLVGRLAFPDHAVGHIRLAPDGKTVVALATHETTKQVRLRVWSLPAGRELRDIVIALRPGEKGFVPEAPFSAAEGEVFLVAEGKVLVVWMADKDKENVLLRRWDFATGRELPSPTHRYHQDQKPILSPNGKFFAVGVKQGKKGTALRLLDAATGETCREFGPVMAGRLFGIRFSPDGRTLLAAEEKHGVESDAVHLWNVADGKPLPAPALDTVYIQDVIFSPDGQTIAVQEEGAVYLCETATGKRRHKLKTYYPYDEMRQTGLRPPKSLPAHSAVAFSPDGKRLAVALWGQLIRLWEVTTGKEVGPASAGHERFVRAIAFAPDGKTVASISFDGTVRLWEAAGGRAVRVLPLATMQDIPREDLPGMTRDVGRLGVTFSPDGQTVAAVCPFNVVQLWAVDTGAIRLRFLIRSCGVSDLLFAPGGKRFLTGGHGRVLRWDAKTGKAIPWPGASAPADTERTEDGDDRVRLALSPDGRLLAVATPAFVLQLRELTTGKLRRRIPDDDAVKRIRKRHRRYGGNVGSSLVAFSPDGKTLAWNQGDAIELVDVMRGIPLRQFGPRSEDVEALAFSPRGSLLAIAGYDGTVHLPNPATGIICGILTVPGGDLRCIAFSPDGRLLATGGDDTTVLLWDVSRILEASRPQPGPPSAAQLEALWQRLAGDSGTDAAEAMARLRASPKEAVALLRRRLRPAAPAEARTVGRLLHDLGSDDFGVRKRAERELEKLGDLAEPFLRKRLAESPPLEVRRRLETLLEALDGFPCLPESMRADRALEVLEHLDTPEARALLRELAGGAPEARLTREAKASLGRLSRHTVKP